MKKIFESQEPVKVISEDSGRCLVLTHGVPVPLDSKDNGLIVEIRSWDDDKNHTDMLPLIGTRLRITVEVLDVNSSN